MATTITNNNQSSSKPFTVNKTDQFLQKCGQCFLLLEQYKLRTNFIGCNMSASEVKKYYNYYESKSRKRLQFCRDRLEGLRRAYERNFVYLQGLQLKTVNNMIKVFRRRMDVLDNQPTDYRFEKFRQDEALLNEWIITSDKSKLPEVQKLITKIKQTQSQASKNLQKQLQTNQGKKQNMGKFFKTINKSQTIYCRYMQNFERSIANMINQIHGHMEKLTQFYNMWQNLGSSLIYQMKSDREVFIDKTLEERRHRNYFGFDQTQEEMLQVIEVMPENSKIRQQYQQKLQDMRAKQMKNFSSNPNMHFNSIRMTSKQKKGNLKSYNQTISKMSWYESQGEDIKEYAFNDSMLLREKQDGYFRYTYEELHHETIDYLESLKNKKNQANNQNPGKQSYFDRFYIYCEKKDRFKEETANNNKIDKVNLPPYMSFNCWFDRLGSKGAFSVLDFPSNIFQRKIQYQSDRQLQMQSLDQHRRKQYNSKQSKLHSFTDQSLYSLGYKQLNPSKEVQKLRLELTKMYDAEYLPKPKNQKNIMEEKKLNEIQDFSESEDEENNYRLKAQQRKQSIQQQLDIKQTLIMNLPQKQIPQKSPKRTQKGSLLQSLQTQFDHIQNQQKKHLSQQQKPKKLKHSIKQLSKNYPWLQVKQTPKQPLQLFVECFLPELQKSLIRKMRTQIQTLGYTQQEMEAVSFKYLPNYQVSAIARSIMQCNKRVNTDKNLVVIDRENINKMYLVNKIFYVKIDPLFFHSTRRVIKIDVVMVSEVHEFQRLKSNLQAVLAKFGRCNFHLNMDLIYQSEGGEQKIFSLIGHLLRDQKTDKNFSSIVASQSEKSLNLPQITKQGEKVYESYKAYYKNCLQIEKDKK